MRRLEVLLLKGGYLTEDIFIPKGLFFQKIDLLQSTLKKNYLQKIEVLISDLQKKKKSLDSVEKTQQPNSGTQISKEKLFLIEINKFSETISKEKSNFFGKLQQPNSNKNVITANVAAASNFFQMLTSKFANKKNDEVEEASYIGELINFFNESYIFEKWLQQYSSLLENLKNEPQPLELQKPYLETIQKINTILTKISEFFYSGVLTFILQDILSVLQKQMSNN